MRPQNSVQREGYLTPDELPDALAKRAFFVPEDPAWFGLLMGALAPLLEESAWRKYGELTPEQCAAAWQDLFFSDPNCGCELPGGGRIIRINPETGVLEELSEDGEWVTPSGDYAVPTITPREGEHDDIRCLAAANAANVLEILYESITDSIAHELELSEAYAAVVTAFIAAVGWEFAPIAFALAAFFLAVFAVVYEIIKIIGADLWDGAFTDTLRCALYGCASDVGEGVVEFDWTCAQNALAAGTNALNFDQLRLFNQLNFIIQVIGGADGLNQAGATTAITEADCGDCAPGWCWLWDFTTGMQGWSVFGIYGEYEAGVGFKSVVVEGTAYSLIMVSPDALPFTFEFVGVTVEYNIDPTFDTGSLIGVGTTDGVTFPSITSWTPVASPNPNTYTYDVETGVSDPLYVNPNGTTPLITAFVSALVLRGSGDAPAFTSGAPCP